MKARDDLHWNPGTHASRAELYPAFNQVPETLRYPPIPHLLTLTWKSLHVGMQTGFY